MLFPTFVLFCEYIIISCFIRSFSILSRGLFKGLIIHIRCVIAKLCKVVSFNYHTVSFINCFLGWNLFWKLEIHWWFPYIVRNSISTSMVRILRNIIICWIIWFHITCLFKNFLNIAVGVISVNLNIVLLFGVLNLLLDLCLPMVSILHWLQRRIKRCKLELRLFILRWTLRSRCYILMGYRNNRFKCFHFVLIRWFKEIWSRRGNIYWLVTLIIVIIFFKEQQLTIIILIVLIWLFELHNWIRWFE